VDAAIDDQLLCWQNRREAKQALFDARARAIKNNALLAKIKAEAIEDAHSLAAEQQRDLLMNSTAAIAPASRPCQNRAAQCRRYVASWTSGMARLAVLCIGNA